MYDVVLSEKNVKDKVFSINSLSELTVTSSGGREEVICKNSSVDFDVLAEEGDIISVLLVSLNGSLVYLRYVLGEWKKYILLDSRSGGKKINSIKLIKLNGRIHAFYCIEYEDRMMLVHHISEDDVFSREPVVIDYISAKCSYDICIDESMNIHILYADEDYKIKHTVFVNSRKNYSKSEINLEDEIRSINCAYFCGSVYAVYLSRERDYNVINCLKTENNEKHTIGFGVDALSEPCIFAADDEMYVEWREKGYAFECVSDASFKFSKPTSLGRSEKTVKIRCHENEAVSYIDKCALNMQLKPFTSCQNILKNLFDKKKPEFKVKGADVEEYASKRFVQGEIDLKIKNIEGQISMLLNSVDNLYKRFDESLKKENFNVPKNDEMEYIESGEE